MACSGTGNFACVEAGNFCVIAGFHSPDIKWNPGLTPDTHALFKVDVGIICVDHGFHITGTVRNPHLTLNSPTPESEMFCVNLGLSTMPVVRNPG